MKKINKLLIVFLVALSMIISGCSSNGGGEDGEQTVKVAVMSPMSGELVRFGEIYKASIEAAMKAVEEDDLLKNYKLEFEYIDDKGTTDGAPAAASLALDQYGAHVSIGHMLTTMILVSAPMYDEANVPMLGIVSGPASVEQGFDYLTIETGTDLIQADTLVEYLVEEKGIERIGLIHVNTEGGASAAKRIEENLKENHDIDLVTIDPLTNNDLDFTAQVLKMKNGDAEAVIFWGLNQSNANVMMQQIEQSWGRVPEDILFAGGTSLAQNQMLETWDEDDIVGVVFPVGYIPNDDNPEIARFIEYFKEADPLGQDPADVPARVYDAVFHLVHALNNLGDYDVNADDFSEKLNTELRQVKFEGVQGSFDYSNFTNGEGMSSMNIGEWRENYSQVKVYPHE